LRLRTSLINEPGTRTDQSNVARDQDEGKVMKLRMIVVSAKENRAIFTTSLANKDKANFTESELKGLSQVGLWQEYCSVG